MNCKEKLIISERWKKTLSSIVIGITSYHIAFPLHYDFLIADVVAYRDNCFNIFMYFAWTYLLFIYIEKK